MHVEWGMMLLEFPVVPCDYFFATRDKGHVSRNGRDKRGIVKSSISIGLICRGDWHCLGRRAMEFVLS